MVDSNANKKSQVLQRKPCQINFLIQIKNNASLLRSGGNLNSENLVNINDFIGFIGREILIK